MGELLCLIGPKIYGFMDSIMSIKLEFFFFFLLIICRSIDDLAKIQSKWNLLYLRNFRYPFHRKTMLSAENQGTMTNPAAPSLQGSKVETTRVVAPTTIFTVKGSDPSRTVAVAEKDPISPLPFPPGGKTHPKECAVFVTKRTEFYLDIFFSHTKYTGWCCSHVIRKNSPPHKKKKMKVVVNSRRSTSRSTSTPFGH